MLLTRLYGGAGDSLEAFKRCALSRVSGEDGSSASSGACGGGGFVAGCSSFSEPTARLPRTVRSSCDSVPEDVAFQCGGACSGGGCSSWPGEGGSWGPPAQAPAQAPSAACATGSGTGAGPSGVFANLPSGRVLQMDILSTWGDPHYVGLTGVELFDDQGEPVAFADARAQLRAEPPDINVLPGYGHDPRVVSNLVDGVLRTCDDLHLWLAPFTRGRRHVVWLDMAQERSLSMVRVWNYNKSRIHSFRGARFIELRLDQHLIFRGEINKVAAPPAPARTAPAFCSAAAPPPPSPPSPPSEPSPRWPQAPGNVPDAHASAEPILFTTDSRIIGRIEMHDAVALAAAYELEAAAAPSATELPQRPPTAERLQPPSTPPPEQLRPPTADVPAALRCSGFARPHTAAVRPPGGPGAAHGEAEEEEDEPEQDYAAAVHPCGRCFKIALHSTWGDPHYVGLNGLELLDPRGQPILLGPHQLTAHPSSVNELPHVSGDPRTADKLLDGVNSTYDDRHMWLAPFTAGEPHSLTVRFDGATRLGAVRLWNYAKTAARGVQQLSLYMDGALLYQGWVRPAPPRAPGSAGPQEDFVQTILMTDNPALIEAERYNVYNKVDLEDDLVIIDNGQQLNHRPAHGGSMCRPTTSAVGPGAPPMPMLPRR